MITENLSTLKIHKLTQAQYDRELAAGNIDANAIYLTPDEAVDLSAYATTDQLDTKQNKIGWITEEDIDAMFAGTYEGTEDEATVVYDGSVTSGVM